MLCSRLRLVMEKDKLALGGGSIGKMPSKPEDLSLIPLNPCFKKNPRRVSRAFYLSKTVMEAGGSLGLTAQSVSLTRWCLKNDN